MAVSLAYMPSTKNLAAIMAEIQHAQVPPKFTVEFLKTLGFSSSNDRAIIGVLKALAFLDTSGVPTERYRRFRNRDEAPYVLAQSLRETYSDLFMARENAQSLSSDRIKGILATKVDKGDSVLEKMTITFRALAALARWDRPEEVAEKISPGDTKAIEEDTLKHEQRIPLESPIGFAYNIQIQLPVTKDISVYNAIFRSIREHLG